MRLLYTWHATLIRYPCRIQAFASCSLCAFSAPPLDITATAAALFKQPSWLLHICTMPFHHYGMPCP